MRIGFDARSLEEEKISGVGEYTLELIKNLLEIDKKNRYIIFSNSFKQKNNGHFEWLNRHTNTKLKRFFFPNKFLNFLSWYLGWPKIDGLIGGADVFFAPNINFLSLSRICPLVTAFHDLSFEQCPNFFGLKTRLWHRYFVNPRHIARKSAKIIAVSDSTKKDLEEIYKLIPEKIDVVYHGISSVFRIIDRNNSKLIEIQKKYKLPYKFILYLGNIEPRKNIASIIEAYKLFVSKKPEFSKYKLVLAGNIAPLCRKTKWAKNIIACGYVERADRPFVYNLSSLFVYPSFFEGFGLPILEAMACGTPVITSHNSSIPEVAGNAAMLINPDRPQEIAQSIESLLSDEKLYNKMRERGLKRVKKFDWSKCAEKTLQIIQNTK